MSLCSIKSRPNKCRGFTLMEIMVTVAILGVLAAVAIPLFATYMYKSKSAEAEFNMKTIYQAGVTYFSATQRLPAPTECTPRAGTIRAPNADKYSINDANIWAEFNGLGNANSLSWLALGWTPIEDFYYCYQFTHDCGNTICTEGNILDIVATGDLDGDTTASLFARRAEVLDGDFRAESVVRTRPYE